MLKYFGIYLFLFVAVQVQGVPLEDQALTRFDPCHGLDSIYFDKLTDTLWKGTVNLGLYPHFIDAKIEINFKDPMIFYGVSQKSKLIIKNEWHDIILVPIGKLPLQYYIYLSVNSTNTVEKPTVTKFTLNNILLCDEQNKNGHVRDRRYINLPELVTVKTDAKAGDWPWEAAILIQETQTDKAKYRTSGNIITSTAILTAGHSLFYDEKTMIATNKLLVLAGTTNLWDLNEVGRQILAVERVVVHPNYDWKSATSDLAILFVNKLVFTKYVQPICVAGPTYDKIKLYGQQAVITSYGLTEQNLTPSTLKASYTRVQRDEICTVHGMFSGLLNEFTLCVGERSNSGIGPQNGGGGLAVAVNDAENNITWYLYGLLSKCPKPNGIKYCDQNSLSIFTYVAPHYDWIAHHVDVY